MVSGGGGKQGKEDGKPSSLSRVRRGRVEREDGEGGDDNGNRRGNGRYGGRRVTVQDVLNQVAVNGNANGPPFPPPQLPAFPPPQLPAFPPPQPPAFPSPPPPFYPPPNPPYQNVPHSNYNPNYMVRADLLNPMNVMRPFRSPYQYNADPHIPPLHPNISRNLSVLRATAPPPPAPAPPAFAPNQIPFPPQFSPRPATPSPNPQSINLPRNYFNELSLINQNLYQHHSRTGSSLSAPMLSPSFNGGNVIDTANNHVYPGISNCNMGAHQGCPYQSRGPSGSYPQMPAPYNPCQYQNANGTIPIYTAPSAMPQNHSFHHSQYVQAPTPMPQPYFPSPRMPMHPPQGMVPPMPPVPHRPRTPPPYPPALFPQFAPEEYEMSEEDFLFNMHNSLDDQESQGNYQFPRQEEEEVHQDHNYGQRPTYSSAGMGNNRNQQQPLHVSIPRAISYGDRTSSAFLPVFNQRQNNNQMQIARAPTPMPQIPPGIYPPNPSPANAYNHCNFQQSQQSIQMGARGHQNQQINFQSPQLIQPRRHASAAAGSESMNGQPRMVDLVDLHQQEQRRQYVQRRLQEQLGQQETAPSHSVPQNQPGAGYSIQRSLQFKEDITVTLVSKGARAQSCPTGQQHQQPQQEHQQQDQQEQEERSQMSISTSSEDPSRSSSSCECQGTSNTATGSVGTRLPCPHDIPAQVDPEGQSRQRCKNATSKCGTKRNEKTSVTQLEKLLMTLKGKKSTKKQGSGLGCHQQANQPQEDNQLEGYGDDEVPPVAFETEVVTTPPRGYDEIAAKIQQIQQRVLNGQRRANPVRNTTNGVRNQRRRDDDPAEFLKVLQKIQDEELNMKYQRYIQLLKGGLCVVPPPPQPTQPNPPPNRQPVPVIDLVSPLGSPQASSEQNGERVAEGIVLNGRSAENGAVASTSNTASQKKTDGESSSGNENGFQQEPSGEVESYERDSDCSTPPLVIDEDYVSPPSEDENE